MAEQTSVRVSKHTRDELNQFADERGLTADRAIAEALKAVRDAEWQRQAERESWEIAGDPLDRAEVAAAIHDLGGE